MPTFWDSPYFVPEPDNWHLTEDAPEELKKEFAEYMKESANESTVKQPCFFDTLTSYQVPVNNRYMAVI